MSRLENKLGISPQKKFTSRAKLLSLGKEICRLSIRRIETKPNFFTIFSPTQTNTRVFSFSHIALRGLNANPKESVATPIIPKKTPLSSSNIMSTPQIIQSPRIVVSRGNINLKKALQMCSSDKVQEEPCPPKGLNCVKLFNEIIKFAKQRKEDIKQLLNSSFKGSSLTLLPSRCRDFSILEKAKEKEMLRVPIENEIIMKLTGANVDDRDTRRQIIINIKELILSFEAVRKHYKLNEVKEGESLAVQDQVSQIMNETSVKSTKYPIQCRTLRRIIACVCRRHPLDVHFFGRLILIYSRKEIQQVFSLLSPPSISFRNSQRISLNKNQNNTFQRQLIIHCKDKMYKLLLENNVDSAKDIADYAKSFQARHSLSSQLFI